MHKARVVVIVKLVSQTMSGPGKLLGAELAFILMRILPGPIGS